MTCLKQTKKWSKPRARLAAAESLIKAMQAWDALDGTEPREELTRKASNLEDARDVYEYLKKGNATLAASAMCCGPCRTCVALDRAIPVDNLGYHFCHYLDRRVNADENFGCTAHLRVVEE